MPAKNALPYLPDCLDSILKQSYSNWELCVVNDHSDDGTNAVLQAYAKKDSRIKVFQNKGKGIIQGLRLAYANSRGEYITRMDADDIMPAYKLKILLGILLENGKKTLATGAVKYISDKPLGNGYLRYQDWLNGLANSGTYWQEIYKECVIASPCWMLYREDLEDCGAFHADTYPEDYDLCFRFREKNLKVVASSEILHYWRDYASRSSRTDDNYADNRFLDLKVHYFLKLDYNPKQVLHLWGAGKKGKTIAKKLLEKNIPFRWLCDNPNKIGHNIYGVILEAPEELKTGQYMILVAKPEEQAKIKIALGARNGVFWFC